MKPGSQLPISTRMPSVYVEYDTNNGRQTKFFEQAHQARSFYSSMLRQNRNPRVVSQPLIQKEMF